ncbi:hypothetical protein ACFE04_011721 [Oxalis oulophora]
MILKYDSDTTLNFYDEASLLHFTGVDCIGIVSASLVTYAALLCYISKPSNLTVLRYYKRRHCWWLLLCDYSVYSPSLEFSIFFVMAFVGLRFNMTSVFEQTYVQTMNFHLNQGSFAHQWSLGGHSRDQLHNQVICQYTIDMETILYLYNKL